MTTLAIAGNPNCGKSLIFNRLTGSNQKVGNWSGVTVTRKEGHFSLGEKSFSVVDLPGAYALHTHHKQASIDERIACEYLLSGKVDIILNVVDASNLERHLYFTAQLLEMGLPVIVLLNMTDLLINKGLSVDVNKLRAQLGCPIVLMNARKNKGFAQLKKLLHTPKPPALFPKYNLPVTIEQAQQQLSSSLEQHANWLALRLLEDDQLAEQCVNEAISKQADALRKKIEVETGEPSDLLIADSRYAWSNQCAQHAVQRTGKARRNLTQILDNIVLNRFLGIPIFLLMMYATFFFAINVGGAFQDFFDISSTTIFIDGLTHLLQHLHASSWLIALLANGLGKGINTVLTFIPVIGCMFLFLAILEDSGYMARAAFVVDRLMQAIGLPGKAFVPLIVGFGCNVPTVMAARTLGSERDRILTIMMAPFMSCGARLAIYAVFVSAFFPHGGQNIIFLLYLIGILVAVLTGLLLRYTLLRAENIVSINELPAYHVPHTFNILRSTWNRLKMFLSKAGRFIIPICIIIGALNAVNFSGKLIHNSQTQNSILSSVGKIITPIFAPMGIKQENWPAAVGLFTGMLAKEVVVGTLNTLYSQVGDIQQEHKAFNLRQGLDAALQSIPDNLATLPKALSNPILASAPIQHVNDGVYGVMSRYFDGKIGAFAYLLFILLYFPCVTTMAVMRRELKKSWATFSMAWSTGLAYGIATLFYQLATFTLHPLNSTLWSASIILIFVGIITLLRIKTGPYHAKLNCT
jgi:ferrous iron transport protein B